MSAIKKLLTVYELNLSPSSVQPSVLVPGAQDPRTLSHPKVTSDINRNINLKAVGKSRKSIGDVCRIAVDLDRSKFKMPILGSGSARLTELFLVGAHAVTTQS